jgi:predicted O-linked N-acetylglucosamine transferase (SPINDLY family)
VIAASLGVPDLIDIAARLCGPGEEAFRLELYRIWLAHNAAHPLRYAVLFNYGVLLADSGDVQSALTIYQAAAAEKADFLAPYINLGTLQERLGHPDAAIASWMKAAEAPTGVSADTIAWKVAAWKQIGRALEAARRERPAEDALRRGLELQPNQPDAIQHLLAMRQAQCRWPVVEPFGHVSALELMKSMSPLSLGAYADDPVLQLANAHRTHLRETATAEPVTAGCWPPPDSRERRALRVGYLSSDLRDHAVGFLTADLYRHHNRRDIEVFAYYMGPAVQDALQARIRAGVDHWTDISTLTDRQAATAMVADGIDILVDLNGYTRDGRTKLVAMRPAPIIVNWLGYPGSMGSAHHHYIIADSSILPPEHERFYTEKVLRLPCYQPTDRQRLIIPETPSRAACDLPDDATVFCCFNGANKITRTVFDRWLSILLAVPDSVLWLLATNDDTTQHLKAIAAARQVAPERVIVAPRRANPYHLARYRLADLFLDTTPYGAHTTASDALWMGVPVLTYPGNSFPSRVCTSLVRAAGLPELVCRDAAHYMEMAVRLGRDSGLRGALRARLAQNRDSCTLFDTPLLARSLEQLYAAMWQDYCQGRLPVPDLTNLPLYHEIGCSRLAEHEPAHDLDTLCAWYRTHMAYRHAVAPLRADRLLWDGDAPGRRDVALAA